MMPALTRCEDAGIVYFTDDGLFDTTGVRIAFTGRIGGASPAPYDSLNLADHVGDDPKSVSENRKMLLDVLNAPDDALLANPNQVHGTGIWDASRDDSALIPIGDDMSQPVGNKMEADAVHVDDEGIAAMLCYADCVPVILVAEDGRFIVVHAGWRGAIDGIVEKAVKHISNAQEAASSSSSSSDDDVASSASHDRIFAYIGPCIHRECFEVSSEVSERFAKRYGEGVVAGDHVDLPFAIREALVRSGVSVADIVDVGICTVCDDGFFSYRGSGGTTGRHAAIAFKA